MNEACWSISPDKCTLLIICHFHLLSSSSCQPPASPRWALIDAQPVRWICRVVVEQPPAAVTHSSLYFSLSGIVTLIKGALCDCSDSLMTFIMQTIDFKCTSFRMREISSFYGGEWIERFTRWEIEGVAIKWGGLECPDIIKMVLIQPKLIKPWKELANWNAETSFAYYI